MVAALGTAVSFCFTATFFTLAGRQIGSGLVNRSRLVGAVACLVILHWLVVGSPLPTAAAPERWFWLGLSGLIGLALGDAFLFQAFVTIGPRLSMLVMALAPILAAVLAWLALGEALGGRDLVGIALALTGVALVISEPRESGPDQLPTRAFALGLLLALGGATGQAAGLVTSKLGLVGEFSALSGNLIRMLAATAAIWAVTVAQRQVGSSFRTLRRSPAAVRSLALGVIFGPVLGVWLSLIAVQKAPVGIASTLMSLTPIFLIPVGRLVFDDRITRRAVIGTVVAVAGTGVLFLGG